MLESKLVPEGYEYNVQDIKTALGLASGEPDPEVYEKALQKQLKNKHTKEKKKMAKIRKQVQENTEMNEKPIELITDTSKFLEFMKEFPQQEEESMSEFDSQSSYCDTTSNMVSDSASQITNQ